MCLLGPNGSGKSTTMNCIAGQYKISSGSISIDPSGGLGYAPQNNVIWYAPSDDIMALANLSRPDLTVEEHVRVFSDLKCIAGVNEEIVSELVRGCDLEKKLPCRAKTLSGGQKRKLQLAMMFAGGSAVCCVDEVSTGLDPISRRRIWEILLAERHRRTIIMTTHFLDEADYLADNIAIMYKGSLRAEGTSATLKNRYGSGFTIKLPDNINLEIPLSGQLEREDSRNQIVYRLPTANLAAELVEYLESQGVHDYQISGPTMEELFLKATGDTIASAEAIASTKKNKTTKTEVADSNTTPVAIDVHTTYELRDGRPISAFHQWYLLFCKRFLILRRRWIPYFVAVAFAIVGAGIAPLLIKSFNKPMQCPTPAELVYDYTWRSDFTSGVTYTRYLFGPPSALNEDRLAQMTETYSVNHTDYPSDYYGYKNVTQLKDNLIMVNSLEELTDKIKESQKASDGYSYFTNRFDGGLWLADGEQTVVVPVQQANSASQMLNFFNVMLSGVNISSGYSQFGDQQMPDVFEYKPLLFMIYYGLILAA